MRTANRSVINNYRPKCGWHTCTNLVRYHDKYVKVDGTVGAIWKMFCEYHRTTAKIEIDEWKLSQGCTNVDTHLGFKCESKEIVDPELIQVNHIDGNRLNTDFKNLECLCKPCHDRISLELNHNQNRYSFVNKNFDKFFTTKDHA